MKLVLASREGLIGGITSAGLTIRPNSLFVALPSRRALWKTVRVVYAPKSKSVICPVLDVGPWFPFRNYPDDDDYVFGASLPLAVIKRGSVRDGDHNKYRVNGAGIDLSDAVIEQFGFEPEQWGIRSVEWEFVE